ncbi:uncharacterized protein LOC143286465 [Babylonia areolata]|uniref:uncharacterized protein LOC143286465 n=1 Tax=Babylonia areolata TaxID=304850 RepID=UPI003FD0A334
MGVTGLWSILCPVKKRQELSSLQGQTLAVDLSMWVCENQGVRQMQNRVLKPHLRNLFFRISTLLQLGIKPVFVIEGEAPALKHEEMGRRLQARHGGINHGNTKRKFARGRLQGMLKECCDLLDALGVPYIQSQGEAEATCAALNAAGVVDACVSDDGDCFLYGAKVVYRNLTIDAKDPHVDSFSMEDVTSELSLTRERLVALALLLGCDYFPAGVPGVGVTWAVNLMTSLAGVDVLKRFGEWKSMKVSDCLDNTEVFVWRRASTLPNFPPEKVVEEFLVTKDPEVSAPPQWHRPCILKMMRLGSRYLEWPEDYSVEKALPLTTLWDQLHFSDQTSTACRPQLQPCRIVKKRVRQGVPCFEVEWENNIKGLVDESGQPRRLVTLEQENRFQTCFPALVDSFTHLTLQLKEEKSKKSRKGKSKKDVDALSSQLDALTVSSQRDPADDPALATHCSSQSRVCVSPPLSTPGGDVTTSIYRPLESSGSLPSFHSAAPSGVDRKGNSVAQHSAVGSHAKDTEPKASHCVAGSEDSSPRSPSVINRSMEYVPLSQRLNVLAEGDSMGRTQDCDIVDLDDSYTYIPLSQRLKARLGSQQKVALSSASAAGVVSSLQDASHPVQNHSLRYVPLSQRLRSSLDSADDVDGVFMNPSPPTESEAPSSPRRLESAFDAESVQTSGADSVICEQGSHQSVICTTDCGTDKQTGTQNILHNVLGDEPLQTMSKTCMSFDKAKESGDTVQGSMPKAVSAADRLSSHTSDNVSDSDDSSAATTHSQNAPDHDFHVSRTVEDQIMKNEKPAALCKRLAKKKKTVSQDGMKGGMCSPKPKTKISVTDLLENWSDSESETDNCPNSDPVVTVSGDDSDPEPNAPAHMTHGDCLPGSIQTSQNNAKCLSERDLHGEDSPLSHSSQPKHVLPDSSTPCHATVVQAKNPDSVCKQSPSQCVDVDSFVSDGHFTLHHTLFTSMEEADDSQQSSDSELQLSQHTPCHGTAPTPPAQHPNTTGTTPPAQHPNTTAPTPQHPNTTAPTPPAQRPNTTGPTPPAQHPNPAGPTPPAQHPNTTGPQHDHQLASDSDHLESPSQDQTWELRRSMQHPTAVLNNQAVLLGDWSDDDDEPRPQAAENKSSEEKGLLTATPVASADVVCEAAGDSRQGEGVSDACCLTLSQRLQLKKSTAKTLSMMINKF